MAQEGSFKNPSFDRFDSVADFMGAVRDHEVDIRDKESWTGETRDQVTERIDNGYTGAVADADRVLSSIDCDINTMGLAPQWGLAPVGVAPNVGAFLAGSPDCMYHKSYSARQNNGEINLYYCPIASAGISHEDSFRRGVVVLSAVIALSRVRPVNCYYFTCMGKGDHIVKIRTNPLVLSEAAYMLTSTAVWRAISLQYASKTAGWKYDWGKWSCTGGKYGQGMTEQEKVDHMKQCLGLGEDDILIPGHHLDRNDITANPAAWVNGLLDKYRG